MLPAVHGCYRYRVSKGFYGAANLVFVRTKVNGALRQDDTTDRMIFPMSFLISYISRFSTLEPGDLILTGSPTGAGARLDPPRYLVPGDTVEVEVSRIGTLRNRVIDEPTA